MGDAICIVEYSSVSYGIGVLDRMVKRSSVTPLYARPVCVGRYLIVLGGEVDSVKEAMAVVEETGSHRLLSKYLLTSAHQDILAYFHRPTLKLEEFSGARAVGLFETRSAAAGFQGLDRALKSGSVELIKLWMGHFLGGKSCFVLAGEVGDVEAAISAAHSSIQEAEVVDSQIIPSPDPLVLSLLSSHYGS